MPLIPMGLPAEEEYFAGSRHRFNAPFLGREDRHYQIGDIFPNFACYNQQNTPKKIRDFSNKPVIVGRLPAQVVEGTALLERLKAYTAFTFILIGGDRLFRPVWDTEFHYSDEVLLGTDVVIFIGDGDGNIVGNLVNDDQVFESYVVSAVDQEIMGFIPDLTDESLEKAMTMIGK